MYIYELVNENFRLLMELQLVYWWKMDGIKGFIKSINLYDFFDCST